MNKRSLSDHEILERIPDARAREEGDRASGLRATAAFYDSISDLIVIETTRGIRFGFPRRVIAELRKASKEQLARLTLSPSGAGLHWDALDVQLSGPGLLIDALGPGAAARELARRGGKVTSKAKADAARRNGIKGGRPAQTESGSRAAGYSRRPAHKLLVKESARSQSVPNAGSRKKRG
jgi:hypothetical protein